MLPEALAAKRPWRDRGQKSDSYTDAQQLSGEELPNLRLV